jgi:hypothetical protein
MAHYAKVQNNLVTTVIVAEAEFFNTFVDTSPGEWIQTSYNTRGGIHYDPTTGQASTDQSKALRKNYAGIGYTYNNVLDAFIAPQPFASWTLDEETCLWNPPTPYPSDVGTDEEPKRYIWDETTVAWILVEVAPA